MNLMVCFDWLLFIYVRSGLMYVEYDVVVLIWDVFDKFFIVGDVGVVVGCYVVGGYEVDFIVVNGCMVVVVMLVGDDI